eukprot:Phypoly_transcript_16332.p1 GENE.Phypoly_transcript_16332~~Phypoly_transcript_16332.p1  ORF type:complete len:210 (+),score=70.77 Phypoly_transcript_16332:127-756(+)
MKEQYQIITQAFVARRVMSDADLHNLVQQVTQACPGLSDEEARADNLITTINENLRTLSLEIRKAIAETDAVLYWGLVNMRLDPHIQAATTLGAGELALFKKLIDMIVEEAAGHVALTDALLAAKEVAPPLTATRAQALVAQLCRERWLFDLSERRNNNNNNNNNSTNNSESEHENENNVKNTTVTTTSTTSLSASVGEEDDLISQKEG